MDAERERVDGFGRLEDGLHQVGEWVTVGAVCHLLRHCYRLMITDMLVQAPDAGAAGFRGMVGYGR